MMTLEERVTRLEDIRACEQLQYQYEKYLDDGYLGEKIASLFVEDGLWSIAGVGGTAKGREAIIAHAKNLGKSIPWGQHHMIAPMIEIAEDGEHANGTFRLFCTITIADDDGKEHAYVMVGKYKTAYRKVNGKWYYTEIVGDIERSALWDKGWVLDSYRKESWQ